MARPPQGPTIFGLLQPFSYGRGYVDVVTVAPPAANSPWVFTCPGDRHVRPLVAKSQLVTSAVVTARRMSLRLLDASGTLVGAWGDTANSQAASVTAQWIFTAGLGYSGTPAVNMNGSGIPQLFLAPGWQLQGALTGADAADQISAVVLLAEILPLGPSGYPRPLVQPAEQLPNT